MSSLNSIAGRAAFFGLRERVVRGPWFNLHAKKHDSSPPIMVVLCPLIHWMLATSLIVG